MPVQHRGRGQEGTEHILSRPWRKPPDGSKTARNSPAAAVEAARSSSVEISNNKMVEEIEEIRNTEDLLVSF